jgi:hypothetical protein
MTPKDTAKTITLLKNKPLLRFISNPIEKITNNEDAQVSIIWQQKLPGRNMRIST